jgi:hypothetical protein
MIPRVDAHRANVLAALQQIGWTVLERAPLLSNSRSVHLILTHRDDVELDPAILVKIPKDTGLSPDDLWSDA